MKNHKLHAARAKMHWSMEVAAEKIGVSKTSIARWENGEQKPRGASLDLVCAAYKMSAEELGLVDIEHKNITLPLSLLQDKVAIASTTELLPLLELENSLIEPFDATRRSVVSQLLKAMSLMSISPQIFLENHEPWESLIDATGTTPTTMNAASFNHFEEIVKRCWGLCDTGELSVAENILSAFLPNLIQLAPYQHEASVLAAQGLQLRSILAAHNLRLTDKLLYCQQAVAYARLNNNSNTLATTLSELMVALRYTEQYGKHNNSKDAFDLCQENLYYSDKTSPLVRTRTYREAAIVLAQCGRKQEALFYRGLADEIFPDHPENDPSFWFADCGVHTLLISDIFVYLELGEGKHAWEAFDTFKNQHPSILTPERVRLEIVNHLGRAAIMTNDIDKYAYCLQDGLTGAVMLRSKKRLEEAWNIYLQEMPKEWSQEPQIKQIAEQFQLPKVQ